MIAARRRTPKSISLLLATGLATVLTGAADPAPADAVTFPQAYRTEFIPVRHFVRPEVAEPRLIAVYANRLAAAVTDPAARPYPAGAIFVMEWANAAHDEHGDIVREPTGEPRRGSVARLDVMMKPDSADPKHGSAPTAGAWRFTSFRPDGVCQVPPPQATACAACHERAGASRDYVFAGAFAPAEKH